MANQTVTIVNGNAASVDNVNAAGDDVPAYSSLTVTLTDAELTTLTTAQTGIAVIKSTTSETAKHWISKVLRVGRNPGI